MKKDSVRGHYEIKIIVVVIMILTLNDFSYVFFICCMLCFLFMIIIFLKNEFTKFIVKLDPIKSFICILSDWLFLNVKEL
jgi:hypothetical protein